MLLWGTLLKWKRDCVCWSATPNDLGENLRSSCRPGYASDIGGYKRATPPELGPNKFKQRPSGASKMQENLLATGRPPPPPPPSLSTSSLCGSSGPRYVLTSALTVSDVKPGTSTPGPRPDSQHRDEVPDRNRETTTETETSSLSSAPACWQPGLTFGDLISRPGPSWLFVSASWHVGEMSLVPCAATDRAQSPS